ncbi:MAG: hypothetical protein ACO2Z9_11290 [Crocinitomicaceae bacterium]
MKTRTLKTIHFFLCWVYTIISGVVIGAFFNPILSVLVAAVAVVCSLPFIIIFLLGVQYYMKGIRTKSELHRFVFFLHLIGAIVTLLFLSFEIRELDFLIPLIAVYFIIDSIFFHSAIERRYSIISSDQSSAVNSEILDEM